MQNLPRLLGGRAEPKRLYVRQAHAGPAPNAECIACRLERLLPVLVLLPTPRLSALYFRALVLSMFGTGSGRKG